MASTGPPAAAPPSPTGPMRGQRPTWLLVGTAAAIAIIIVVLVFAGIPGVSLTSSSGSSSSHDIIFNETGLPAGTHWTVILRYANDTYLRSPSSNDSSISVAELNGVYLFTVPGIALYTASPSDGRVVLSGSDVTVPITFKPSVPLGTSLSWGTPINATGAVTPGCPLTTGHYCYAIEIAGAGNGVGTSNILLTLRNDVGATVPWPTGIEVSLFSPTNASAVATYDTENASWTLVPPFDGALAGGFSLVFYTAGTGAGNGLFDLQLAAVGQNGFSGTVPSAAFN